jgi:hypothetical protein
MNKKAKRNYAKEENTRRLVLIHKNLGEFDREDEIFFQSLVDLLREDKI